MAVRCLLALLLIGVCSLGTDSKVIFNETRSNVCLDYFYVYDELPTSCKSTLFMDKSNPDAVQPFYNWLSIPWTQAHDYLYSDDDEIIYHLWSIKSYIYDNSISEFTNKTNQISNKLPLFMGEIDGYLTVGLSFDICTNPVTYDIIICYISAYSPPFNCNILKNKNKNGYFLFNSTNLITFGDGISGINWQEQFSLVCLNDGNYLVSYYTSSSKIYSTQINNNGKIVFKDELIYTFNLTQYDYPCTSTSNCQLYVTTTSEKNDQIGLNNTLLFSFEYRSDSNLYAGIYLFYGTIIYKNDADSDNTIKITTNPFIFEEYNHNTNGGYKFFTTYKPQFIELINNSSDNSAVCCFLIPYYPNSYQLYLALYDIYGNSYNKGILIENMNQMNKDMEILQLGNNYVMFTYRPSTESYDSIYGVIYLIEYDNDNSNSTDNVVFKFDSDYELIAHSNSLISWCFNLIQSNHTLFVAWVYDEGEDVDDDTVVEANEWKYTFSD